MIYRMKPSGHIAHAAFPSTQWTRLEQERATATGTDWFCEAYRPAILACIRQNFSHHDAEDLCQEFFRQVVLEGPLIERADRDRGHLRGLLRVALNRFLIDYRRGVATTKRGGQAIHHSLDGGADGRQPAEVATSADLAPDRAFDRAWATHLLARAMTRTEQYCAGKGKEALFSALKPLLEGSEPVRSHADIGADLGLTAREITVALRNLRLRVGTYLHDEVVATVAAQGSVAEEMEAIQQALRPS